MFKIIMGLVFLICGLSGKLVLRGFDSPELLAAIGAVMIVWGISQVRRNRLFRDEYRQAQADFNPSPEFRPPEDDTARP